MPSHPNHKTVPTGNKKYPGGPLKRKDDNWDRIVGSSIDVIPGNQLPQVRTILQRYRALRIENTFTDTTTLAKIITQEVLPIWERAGVPTIPLKNCVPKVEQSISLYTKLHNAHEAGAKVELELNSLLDLAPKRRGKVTESAQNEFLKEIMRNNKEKKGTDVRNWEQDYNFYLDQKVYLRLLYAK